VAPVTEFNQRAADVQLRIADRIAAFARSMRFVYLHASRMRRDRTRPARDPRGPGRIAPSPY